MANGWNTLGAVLGGGGALKQQAYQMGVEGGARQADLLEQARARRDQNLGMAQITPEALSTVDPVSGTQLDPGAQQAQAANILSALFHAKIDPRQLSGYQAGEQGIGFKNQAMAAATAANPDVNLLGRMMTVISGKPTTLTSVKDGVSFDPSQTPDSQHIDPTQIGLTQMLLNGAKANDANAGAGAHNAAAGASNAMTRLRNVQTAAGGFNPHTGEGAGGTKPTLAPSASMTALLGTADKYGDMRPSVPNNQNFITYQATKAVTDPRFNNGAFALQQYVKDKPAGSGLEGAPTPDDISNPITAPNGVAFKPSTIADALGVKAPTLAAPAQSAASPAATAMKKNGAGAAMPTSKADYDSLPSGALFVNPADGQLRRKK